VLSYLKIIEDKAAQLSGLKSLSSSDQTKSKSFLVTLPRCREFSAFEDFDRDEGDDDSDGSDIDANPGGQIQIADELLLETQHEDQLTKIDGDIEEQEERLLQLKKRSIQYFDMKEKYEILTNEVQKLEAEKQELIEKLEKAQSSEGSSWIKSKLDQVKASLVRARLDVRKQQQKCRDAELDAQRCKGLERRIEEMKSIKANLIKKQQDDAKRQRDFSKTKTREIQDARRRENAAKKRILKLEGENMRLKANLERSQARYDDLSKKLKETESNLKEAFSARRKNRAISDVETTICASSNARTDSIKHVLDKTVTDRVLLTQNRLVYKSKVALRESLFHSLTTETKMLNSMKRECEAMEHSIEKNADIKDREDNIQDFLIQIELVENYIEELRAKFPMIEDESVHDAFDEHEPALKLLSKLNSSDLRTLLLRFLSSTYLSEVSFYHVTCHHAVSFQYANGFSVSIGASLIEIL
jgi:DNA repair exonuclease SbcCD ATPase subunit